MDIIRIQTASVKDSGCKARLTKILCILAYKLENMTLGRPVRYQMKKCFIYCTKRHPCLLMCCWILVMFYHFFFFFNNKIKHIFFVLYIYIVCIYKLICYYVLKYISDVNICGTFFCSQQSPSLSEGFRTSHSSMM